MPKIESFADTNPATTKMMKRNGDEKQAKMNWVSLENISPRLVRAVLLSEDPAFFWHHGIDWGEFRLAMKQNIERRAFYRGGSTITMQLARNLFISPSRNPLRKIEEMIVAMMIEKKLSKKRTLELYLNIAEWGPHIYGAEAGAQYHFGTSASNLTVDQACGMAAILPSPKKWNPNKPGKMLTNRIARLKDRYETFPQFLPEDLAPKD